MSAIGRGDAKANQAARWRHYPVETATPSSRAVATGRVVTAVGRAEMLEQFPELPTDPAWSLIEKQGGGSHEHDVETRLAIGNGSFGMRASLEQPPPEMYTRSFRPGLPSSAISSCTLRAAASVNSSGAPLLR